MIRFTFELVRWDIAENVHRLSTNMEIQFVIVFVLISALNGSFGLSLARKEINSAQDVYKIIEDKNTNSLTFVNPKSEKPTLREIVYYHIIETPYEQEKPLAKTVVPVVNDTDNDLEPTEEPAQIALDDSDDNKPLTEDVNNGGNENIINANPTEEPVYPVQNTEDSSLADDQSSPVATETEKLMKAAADADSIKQMGWMDFIKAAESKRRKRELNSFDVNGDIDIKINKLSDEIAVREERSSENQGKTYYGMSLTGDSGVVWNNFNNKKSSYFVGGSLNQTKENKDANAMSRINATQKDITDKLEKAESKETSEDPGTQSKTYGMSLTGDKGVVWNNLGDRNDSYAVGVANEVEENKNVEPILKISADDEKINAKIQNFQKDLDKAASKEESSSEPIKQSNGINPNGDNVEAIEDKPPFRLAEDDDLVKASENKFENAKEPDTKEDLSTKEDLDTKEEPIKSTKTYGMSLTGDHGVVWNDLSGRRVSYHVGDPTNDTEKITTEPSITEISTTPNVDNIFEPSDENTKNPKPDSSKEIDDAFIEINKLITGVSKENNTQQNDTNNKLEDKIMDIITEVIKNETAELDEKANSNRTDSKKDEDKFIVTSTEGPPSIETPNIMPDAFQDVMKNGQFWKWLNDWSAAYTDLMINRIDNRISEEVAKQIKEYFKSSTYNNTKPSDENISENKLDNIKEDTRENVYDKLQESVENSTTKKRNDKECEGRKEKDTPVKITANTVYGNSVGNVNVTNVFIFNINKKSDLNNVKPLINGTNGIYFFGNDDNNSNKDNVATDRNETSEYINESLTNPDEITSVISTSKPDGENNSGSINYSPQEFITKIPENTNLEENEDTPLSDPKANIENSVGDKSGKKNTKYTDEKLDIDARFGTKETADKSADKKEDPNKSSTKGGVENKAGSAISVEDSGKTDAEKDDNNKENEKPSDEVTGNSNEGSDKNEDNINKSSENQERDTGKENIVKEDLNNPSKDGTDNEKNDTGIEKIEVNDQNNDSDINNNAKEASTSTDSTNKGDDKDIDTDRDSEDQNNVVDVTNNAKKASTSTDSASKSDVKNIDTDEVNEAGKDDTEQSEINKSATDKHNAKDDDKNEGGKKTIDVEEKNK